MQSVTELEAQIYELRERYDAVLERRIEHLNVTGYFETAVPDQCDNPDFEMEAIEDWLSELRSKLVELKPEEYHYGRELKSITSLKNGKCFSKHGDNGYFICQECSGIFKHQSYYQEKKMGVARNKESFKNCVEHQGRKMEGTIKIKLEEMTWL